MMRLTVAPFLFCLALTLPTQAEVVRLSQPVLSNATSETFGSPLNSTLPKVTLANLLTNGEQHLGKHIALETRIAKVCQRKGCFFIAQQGKHSVRISFKDYGFFIPTDSSGKTVTLTGELVKKERNEKQAQHFSKDLNAKANTVKSGLVYEIVADSVQIPLGK